MNLQDDQLQQDTSTQSASQPQEPIVPSGVPTGGFGKSAEAGFSISNEVSITPEVEPTTESVSTQVEAQKPVETEPTPEKQETFVPLSAVAKKEEPAQPQQPATNTPPAEKPNVVDKTNQQSPLHHLQHPHDKLTNLADEEEEKFIKDVKAAHQHDHGL